MEDIKIKKLDPQELKYNHEQKVSMIHKAIDEVMKQENYMIYVLSIDKKGEKGKFEGIYLKELSLKEIIESFHDYLRNIQDNDMPNMKPFFVVEDVKDEQHRSKK